MSKEILAALLQASALLLPLQLAASPKPLDFSGPEEASGFFVSGQYKPAFPVFRGFAVEVQGQDATLLAVKKSEKDPVLQEGLAKADKFEGTYSPKYEKNLQAGSVCAGYSTGRVRIEAEGMHQRFLVSGLGFAAKDNAKRFAVSTTPSSTGPGGGATGPAQYKPQALNEGGYATIENEEISVSSLMGNVCYDVLSGTSPTSPSVCMGVGGSAVTFLGVTALRVSYQVKAGIQYSLSPVHTIFLNGYASRVQTQKFHNVPLAYQGSGKSSSNHTHIYPSGKLDMDYWGVECGLRLGF